MRLNKIFFASIFFMIISSCADYKNIRPPKDIDKKYYSSIGFALIYDDYVYEQKIIDKKINNEDLVIFHSFLKRNTPVKIINPDNMMFIEAKVNKNAKYPGIYNVVISKEISKLLKLDPNNPYVEIIEIKKNKKFIAKKSNTFDEEKNVAEKAPVEEIKVDDLSSNKTTETTTKEKKYIIIIGDFYYEDSAISLMNNINKKLNLKNISIKKINNTKYRVLAGPFKNFNALKTSYISLNNLGFENLNIDKK